MSLRKITEGKKKLGRSKYTKIIEERENERGRERERERK